MQTAVTRVTAIFLCLVAQGSAAPSPAPPTATIEQCAKLLPHGKKYTFVVDGTIDNSGATPVVHGELSLSDATNEDLTQEAGPFAQCFAKLVR